jgi:hypothetical protein
MSDRLLPWLSRKGIWKDLVLGRKFTALLMEHEHFTYPEAIDT